MGIVLHTEDENILKHLMKCKVGLELESQRIDRNGRLSQRPHPFPGDPVIDRDFGEAQIEIGTPPEDSLEDAVNRLKRILRVVHSGLEENGELLWPFSNPPVIMSEEDIKIAEYEGEKQHKTEYRKYLAEKYGRYKMTFSGIHFNYSFSPKLLAANLELDNGGDFREYKDRFYLELAQKTLEYGWLIAVLLGASPVVDSSFYTKGSPGQTVFTGKSSLRCSDSGYWNTFVPYIDYSSIRGYADSIKKYVDNGMLLQETELYYPVRIKNPGIYSLAKLTERGVGHIELRTIDLNPFSDYGIDLRDAEFLKLFLVWLSGKEAAPMDADSQIRAINNFKAAASYDIDAAEIIFDDGRTMSFRSAAEMYLEEMMQFFEKVCPEVCEYILFQTEKIRDDDKRYAKMVLDRYGDHYIEKGLSRAEEIQEAIHV